MDQTIKICRRAGARHWRFWLAQVVLPLALYAAQEAPPSVPGQILIRPKARLSESDLAGRLSGHGAAQRKKLRHLNVRVIAVAESKTEAVLAALRNDPDIEFAEPDYLARTTFVPNDTYMLSGDEWHLAKIQSPQAWDVTTGRTNVVVAVIDSGINTAHPDLAGRILPGYDFVSGGQDTSDDLGHGTAVAGVVVAAGNNGVGVAGVAYDCTVLPVKVMGTSGLAAYSTVAEGIEYAVNHGVRVINLSLAGSSPSLTLQNAINYAWSNSVVVVAAVGNNANSVPQYPAACEYVVAVAATASDDSLVWFSSYGSFLTLSAPGDNIWTTQRDPLNPYGAWRGTSFASPIVAGVASLIASANPLLSNTQIVDILERTADDLGPAGYDTTFGYGRVNAFRAVSTAVGKSGRTPPVPTFQPTVNLSNPADKAEFTTNVITLSGAALDNMTVEQVLVKVNSGSFQSATVAWPTPNTANWIMPVTLVAGTNTVQVKAVDSLGNESALVSRRFFLQVPSPLMVRADGNGSVTPNLGGLNLFVGRAYTMTAVPGTNCVFTNWVSTVDGVTRVATNAAKITFLMQTNLELVANFAANSFIGAAGTYYGLFSDPAGVAHQSAGAFRFSVDSKQRFTARFYLDGDVLLLSSRMDLAGRSIPKAINRKGRSPVTVRLALDLEGGEVVSGTVSNANSWVANLFGERAVYNLTDNPATAFFGKYTMIIPGHTNSASFPAGDGYGVINVKTNGQIVFKGAVADGGRARPKPLIKPQLTGVSRNGGWAFYSFLYPGQRTVSDPVPLTFFTFGEGSIMGWLYFTNGSVQGDVFWIKPSSDDELYPNGFTNQIAIVASPYTPPPAGVRALNITNGMMMMKDGNLSVPYTNHIVWKTNNMITMVPANLITPTTVFTPSGLIRSTFYHPVNGLTGTEGVLLQNENMARGFFIGTNQSGSFRLEGD